MGGALCLRSAAQARRGVVHRAARREAEACLSVYALWGQGAGQGDAVNYDEFLAHKVQYGAESGFAPTFMPEFLFDFQKALIDWSLRKGRSAIFADCGLGTTPMQLVWAENVVRHTNRSVLILTPLAVASQTVREAEKFGLDCRKSAGVLEPGAHVVVTNYEKLHHFDPSDFSAVVCDESSAIKSFDGKRRAQVTEFLRTVPYRLLCTATAAPNDYIELGTSSEALGEMGHMDMLARFFVNDQNNSNTKQSGFNRNLSARVAERLRWRFKGHAETPFWRWVASWARACRKPSDIGFDDGRFILPALIEREHIVEARTLADGMLFPMTAIGLREEREERRRTIAERCEMVAELVNHDRPAVVWCHLNDEGDRLSKMIPDGRQVKGGDSDEEKEEAYDAFAKGELRVLVIKPKIGAWGLNWQHCAHVVTFASHSYEQYYQSVRRCWRFGQEREVVVDLVATDGEKGVKDNMRRKSEAAARMFTELVGHMNDAMRLDRGARFTERVEVPTWLS